MPKEISYEEAVKEVPLGQGFCQNKVDPTHLLQVIRDMDRRITDLERKLEHSGG